MVKVCLVGCVKTKQNKRGPAADLYISPLFKKSRAWAEQHFERWYILSAKYGLLRPEEIIDPYELTLNQLSAKDSTEWAERVFSQLQRHVSFEDEITILAGARYRERLLPLLRNAGYSVNLATEGLSIGKLLSWLNSQIENNSRASDVDYFYTLLNKLREGLGGGRVLNKCSGRMEWPRRGIYFMFEPGEFRKNHEQISRVVRIGTHGVSKGSQSTLWHRLKTHLGTSRGTGNHRGSIFRLHVGNALLAKGTEHPPLSSWGRGQVAPAVERKAEEPLEQIVSDYIRQMSLLWIAIEDMPGPASDRSFIERNSIGLLVSPSGPADPPSDNWLGRWSPHPLIKKSGLWNLNYLGYPYDPRFLEVLDRYIDVTLRKRPAPNKSIAPYGWYTKKKARVSLPQLNLITRKV